MSPHLITMRLNVRARRQERVIRQPHSFGSLIAMAANAISVDRDKALAAGMNDHIAKLIDVTAMHGTVRRWLIA
jgi:two-component system sensor histidine kinase/response regulator